MNPIIKLLTPAALIFLVNLVLPLSLSAYVLTVILCVLSLLWLSRRVGWNRMLLLLPWSVAFMASVLVTRNFMYPDIETARNTDVNILELVSLSTDSTGQNKVFRLRFPIHRPEDAGQRFEAVVSTDINQILSEDVEAGFYFFDKDGNMNLNFSGTVSYTVGDFQQPLNAVLNVDSQYLAAQGWELKIHDLRDTVKPIWCITVVMVMFLFTLAMMFFGRSSSAASMLGVWLIFIVSIVSRLYNAMRMAYYPPLRAREDLLLRYRSLVLDDPMNNPLLTTVILVFLMMALTVLFRKLSYRTLPMGSSKAKRWLIIIYTAMFFTIFLNIMGIGRVFSHLFLPVSLFFLAQYFCLRIQSRYQLFCYLASYALTLISIGIGDAGFALIWIEFLLIWSLLLINIYRLSSDQINMWRDGLWLARIPIIICLFILLIFPQYAVLVVYEKPLWAFVILVLLGAMVLFSIKTAGLVRQPKWVVAAAGCILFMASLMSFGGSLVLEKGPIVTRAQSIAGFDTNDLLLRNSVSETQRVFSATQNAWYLSENMKTGIKRVFEPGIYAIQPHNSQIVSFGTQISDLLMSRYFFSEVSILYPILLTSLFVLLFTLVCFRRDGCHRHKVLGMGVALFIIVDVVYVFLFSMNLALFVGQDFFLLSGKVKLILDVLLLACLTYPCECEEVHEEDVEELTLRPGAEQVCSPTTAKWLIVILLLTSGGLYAISPLEKGTTPTAFSGKKALAQVQRELTTLNEQLRTSSVPKQKLRNAEDVSQLWAALTDSIDMEQATASMSNLGKSIVMLFDQELKYRNKADTLIFLTLDPLAGYQLRVNEYQWNFELPNYNQNRWHGNILEKYTVAEENASTAENAGIPQGWQPPREVVKEHRKLVRQMCLNGRFRTYYSLRDPWLRNIVSAANYKLKDKVDITLTLDATLQERINDWLRRSNTTSSVIVANGLGELMAMSQYNPSAAVDPNDEAVFMNQRIASALGGKDEESLLKNLNLEIINPGVGSSIKPVTAACAISMLGLRFDQFRIQSLGLSQDVRIREEIQRNSQSIKKYYQTWRFVTNNFSSSWPLESLVGDETGGDDREVSFGEFLAQSSNYYHATLLAMLQGNGGNVEELFHDATDTDIPQVIFGPYRLGLNGTSADIKDSYLSYCLEENFAFGDTHAHDDYFLGPLTTEKTKKLFPLTNPRCAVLNETALQQMSPATRLQRLCTGSIEAYSLSAFQMVESYGKIVSGHRDYTCSLVPSNKEFHSLFRNYQGKEDSLIYHGFRNYLFPALRECCISGTASRWHLDNLWPHVYAKTGTLGTTGGIEDDRMLAIVLSDRALETAEPGEAKFVVVYFRFKNHPLYNIDQIIREILNSRSFSEYMRSNN